MAIDTKYYYYAYENVSGDQYWGYVYADSSYGYYDGYYRSYYSETGGTWSYNITDAVYLGYDSSLTGYNYVYSYYDGETGQYDTPYYYANGYASGYYGLTSESDYVDFGSGTNSYFGDGYYEADAPASKTDINIIITLTRTSAAINTGAMSTLTAPMVITMGTIGPIIARPAAPGPITLPTRYISATIRH